MIAIVIIILLVIIHYVPMIKGHILIISYFKLENVGNSHKTSQKRGLSTAERNLKSPMFTKIWHAQGDFTLLVYVNSNSLIPDPALLLHQWSSRDTSTPILSIFVVFWGRNIHQNSLSSQKGIYQGLWPIARSQNTSRSSRGCWVSLRAGRIWRAWISPWDQRISGPLMFLGRLCFLGLSGAVRGWWWPILNCGDFCRARAAF